MTMARGFLLISLPILFAGPIRAADDWLQEAAHGDLKPFDGVTAEGEKQEKTDRRGKVVIRRISPQCKSDWYNDPSALPYFTYQLQMRTKGQYPCYVNNDGISLLGKEIFDYPVIYFTSHLSFKFSDEEVENLKKYLARGGTLLLDDCTGSGPFMESVPPNVTRIVPGAELQQMSKDSKAYAELFNLIYKLAGIPPAKENLCRPFQAVNVNGRPAILVCPNDYGCAWEVSSPPTPLNPLGDSAHSSTTPTSQEHREQVYQLSINWLFFALTH